jgi:hypothetical protein
MATTILTESQYLSDFRRNHPIADCRGDIHGRWKWEHVNGCINLLRGYRTKAMAARTRMDAARMGYAMYLQDNEPVACPKCHGPSIRKWVDTCGECETCVDARNRRLGL